MPEYTYQSMPLLMLGLISED